MSYRAVIFDGFGTLIEPVRHRQNAYARLAAAVTQDTDGLRLPFLTRNASLAELTQEFGVGWMEPILAQELASEIAGLKVYPEVPELLRRLRGRGLKLAVCSNLAAGYGAAVYSLLPGLDAYVFSYEVGARKPEPDIYQACCDALQSSPRNLLFIGDSKRADFEGPQSFGMGARLIDRRAGDTLERVVDIALASLGRRTVMSNGRLA